MAFVDENGVTLLPDSRYAIHRIPDVCRKRKKWVSFILTPVNTFLIPTHITEYSYPPPLRSTITNPPINLPQIHPLYLPLGNLAHDASGPPSHDRETRHNHIRRHHRPIQNLDVVLDNRKLANRAIRANRDVRADERGFDDGRGADEDVVGDF